jgi:hypothetical protein
MDGLQKVDWRERRRRGLLDKKISFRGTAQKSAVP